MHGCLSRLLHPVRLRGVVLATKSGFSLHSLIVLVEQDKALYALHYRPNRIYQSSYVMDQYLDVFSFGDVSFLDSTHYVNFTSVCVRFVRNSGRLTRTSHS